MRLITFSRISLAAACLFAFQSLAQQNVISTLIGGGPNNIPAVSSDINGPVAVAFDNAGNYYIAAFNQNRVFKVNSSGALTVLAGSGAAGYAGDGVAGGAANASLNGPYGLVADTSGNVYISEFGNNVIRKVDTTNTINTVAGIQGTCGYNGDGSPATSYKMCNPAGLAADSSGNVYIADSTNCRVRQLAVSTSTISTVAGTGRCGYTFDGVLATQTRLNVPYGVALDGSGNLYISDTLNYRIREVSSATRVITTIAGNGTKGYAGDGGLATLAEISGIDQGVAVNSAGTTVTLADLGNSRVRQFTVGGNINTVAGTGNPSYCGDGGPAISACLSSPEGLAATASGVIAVADPGNNRIREFTVGGNISTVAGNGSASQPTLTNQVPPTSVVLNYPWGALEDSLGDIFASDQGNFMVRELLYSSNLVDFFAGTGVQGYGGDNGPATQALLNDIGGLAMDSSGDVFVADTYNHLVREVNTSGIITTVAGTPGTCGYSGDGGPATSAQLCYPQSVFVDANNNLYIADTNNQVIRLVSGGIISTLAGNGSRGYSGDGGPATAAELSYPDAAAADNLGNVYIADTTNCVIREVVLSTGIINTVAGNGICGFTGDGPATQNELYYPAAVSADINGNLFIADSANNLLRWIDAAGTMVTFAGTPLAGYNGDGGQATAAELNNPTSIAQDSMGNFLFADQSNLRIRGVTAFAGVNTPTNQVNMPNTATGLTNSANLKITGLGPLALHGLSITGDFKVQEVPPRSCGPNLPNGQACLLKILFKPSTSGVRTGTLTIQSNALFGGQTNIKMQGLGGVITFSTGLVPFGNQAVGTTSATKYVKITNPGANSIAMGSIGLTETLDFAITVNSCKNALPPGITCTVGITFTPQTTGSKASSLIVNDSDASSPQAVSITGDGT